MTQRKASRQDRLLERATSPFRERAYHSTSIQDLAARSDEIYASDLPFTEKMRWVLEKHSMAILEHGDPVSFHLHEYRHLPAEQLRKALAIRRSYERVLISITEDGMAAGDFRPVEARVTLLGLPGMLNWTREWQSPKGKFAAREVAGMLTDLVLEGLVRREAGSFALAQDRRGIQAGEGDGLLWRRG